MRKQHKLWAKSSKLLLSLGMMFTLVAPYSVHANEPITPSDGEVTPSDGEVTPSNGGQTNTATSPETGVQETKPVESNLDEGIMPVAATTDMSKPVFENLTISPAGKTFKVGDKIKFSVKAYDAEVAKKDLDISISIRLENSKLENLSDYDSGQLKYNEETDLFEFEYEVKSSSFDIGYVSNITLDDGTYRIYENGYSDSEYKWPFKMEASDVKEEVVPVQSIEFTQNQKTVQRGDTLEITVKLPIKESADISSIRLFFVNNNTYSADTVYLYPDKEHPGTFISDHTIDNQIKNEKFVLQDITATSNTTVKTLEYADKDSIWFEVTGEVDQVKPIIESVEFAKNKSILKSGDSIDIKIKASDNDKLRENASVSFRPVAENLTKNYIYVDLELDENGYYIGQYTIKDADYPCEWYINHISVNDVTGNYAEYNKYTQNESYYFYIKNDDAFVNPTYNVEVHYLQLSEDGNYKSYKNVKKDNIERRTTLKDAGFDLPEIPSPIEGLTFVGWTDNSGNLITDDFTITRSNYSIFAKYDKIVIPVRFDYIDQNGNLQTANEIYLMPEGSTYQNLVDKLSAYHPSDMLASSDFTTWNIASYDIDLNGKIPYEPGRSIYVQAAYKDKKVAVYNYVYFKEDGRRNEERKAELVDANTTYGQLYDKMLNAETPKSFAGLRFVKWTNPYESDSDKVIDNFGYVTAVAEYENYIVRFFVDEAFRPAEEQNTRGAASYGSESDYETVYAVVAEAGETISVPEIPGYKNVVWTNNSENNESTIIVNSNITWYGYGDKVDSPDVDTPTDPDNNGGSASGDDSKVNRLPDATISNYINEVAKAKDGETIVIPMQGTTVVPVELLKSIKGKNVSIKLDMGGYSWTINGMDVYTDNLNDINMEVKFNTNAISNKVIQSIAGDNPVQQLSLTHNGNFGFKGSLDFNIGKEYQGKFGNLYYHDSEGKMVFMNAGKIAQDGNVSLDFTHASDYAVVINDKNMAPTPNELMKGAIKDTSANPADTFNMLWVMTLTGLGMYYYFKKKETEEQA